MDKIRVKNIKIFAYHGVIKEEQNLGQNFEIDVVPLPGCLVRLYGL